MTEFKIQAAGEEVKRLAKKEILIDDNGIKVNRGVGSWMVSNRVRFSLLGYHNPWKTGTYKKSP
jgi:hypothetical protein